MKSVIYKYLVQTQREFALEIPDGRYEVLDVQMQQAAAVLWIRVSADPAAPKIKRWFWLLPTGMEFDDDHVTLKYVGTFQPTDKLTFHLFETT